MIEPPTVRMATGWTNAPYVDDIRFPGQDLTGAAWKMQVRAFPGQPGPAKTEFNISASTAIQPDGVPITVLTVSIGENIMATIRGDFVPDEPKVAELAVDLTCIPAGGYKSVMLVGVLPVCRGVTQQ